MEAGQKPVNIWEQAAKEKSKQLIASSAEKVLLVVGNSSVGKTSFLRVLRNEAESEVKPTYLLDYSYIRRGHVRKELINCYQIATKTQSEIIPSLFTKDNFANVTVAICVDVSRPSTIMEDVAEWQAVLKKQIQNSVHEKIGMQEKFDSWLQKRREEVSSHEDGKYITVASVNVVIVACKYDLYEKYETENRKWLSKALRYLAHTNNASLFFCSSKIAAVGGQLRTSVMELLFQDRVKTVAQTDHLKPIFIVRNQDSLANIAVPSSGSISGVEVLRRQIAGLFSAQEEKKKEGIDTSKYFEPKIDSLIESRKKELAKISKGLGKRNNT